MNTRILRSGIAALALGAVLIPATGLPAKADTTTTQDIVYGAAAAAAAFTLYNVEHKHQLATTVEGYLPNGSTVYEDGRVVAPNGYSWYPGNSGQTVACSNQYCTITGNYNGNGYGYNGGGYYGNNGGYYGNNGYSGNNGNYYGNPYNGSYAARRRTEGGRD